MAGSVSESKKLTSLEVVDNMLVRSEVAYFSGTVNADGIITNNIVVTNGIEADEFVLKEPSPGSNTITFQAPSLPTGSYTLTFPDDVGVASQMLTTDGMGNLSWASSAGGGDVFGPASSTNNAISVFDQTTGKLLRNSGVIIDTNDNVTTPNTITATGSVRSNTSLIVEDPGAGSNTITIQSPTLATGSYSLTLPIDDGAASQVLTTDGSGNLSWAAGGSSPGGSNTEIQFNDGGSFGGNTALTFNKSTTTMSLGSENTTATLSSVSATTANTAGGSLLIKSGIGLGTGSRGITDVQGNVRINYFGDSAAEVVLDADYVQNQIASGSAMRNNRQVAWSPSLNIFASLYQSIFITSERATSSDGLTWAGSTSSTVPGSLTIYDKLIWVPTDSQFVAVGGDNTSNTDKVVTSTDGLTWTTRTAANGFFWQDLVHSTTTGRYVAVGYDGVTFPGQIMYSSDAITWTIATYPATPQAMQSVARSSTTYVAVGTDLGDGSYNIATSSDGITWTSTLDASFEFTSITWVDSLSLFYASTTFGGNHRIATSANGTTWSTISATNIGNTTGFIEWQSDLDAIIFMPDSTSGIPRYSLDGTNFVSIPDPVGGIGFAYSPTLTTLVFSGPASTDFNYFQTSDTSQLKDSVTIGTLDITPNVIVNAPLFLNNNNTGSGTTLQVLGTGEVVEQVSLRSYKTDEVDVQDEPGYQLDDVLKLKPKFFTWKESGLRDLGFVVEDAIEANQAYIYRDEVLGVPKNVKDRSILAGLVAMVKKQQTEIEVLKDSLDKLKSHTGYSEV